MGQTPHFWTPCLKSKRLFLTKDARIGIPRYALAWHLKPMSRKKSQFAVLTSLVLSAVFPSHSNAAGLLGDASDFAILGASTVTSTGNTVIHGNLGVSPGTAITGFLPGIVNGTQYSGGAVPLQGQVDALAAFVALGSGVSIQNLTGIDLGGLTLGAGVRNFNSSAQLTGILTLDAGGDSNARFDFLIGSTLTSGTGSIVNLINGASADNVFWQVGSSATLGVGTAFAGSIIADQSITLNTGASLIGRALALNGAVTLDNNLVTAPIPEAGAFWPLIAGVPALGLWQWRAMRRRKSAEMVKSLPM